MIIGITERGDAALDRSWERAEVGGLILITKALSRLGNPRNLGREVVVHATITGLGGTPVEPRVRPWQEEILHYHEYVEVLGGERVVLRIDPIIPGGGWQDRALEVAREARGRVRISFLDLYPRVRRDLEAFAPGITRFYAGNLHAPLGRRQQILHQLREVVREVEICGEPGLPRTGCVSVRDVRAMGLDVQKLSGGLSRQRPGLCMCLAEKKEVLKERRQCRHGCVYCYWR